jgi:hypothetical protein
MPKRRSGPIALAVALLSLAPACSSSPVAKDGLSQEEINMVSKPKSEAEPGPAAPGMIPADCEALLNKSQAWGYSPAEKWKPVSAELALEATAFFADFRMVPLPLSNALRELDNGGAMPPADAQPCDPFLAHNLLEPLVAYRWGKAERLKAGKNLHRFLLNQQSLFLPLIHRAITGRVFAEAVRQGLVPGSHAKAKAFMVWMEKEIAALPQGDAAEGLEGELKRVRKQVALSGKIRDRMGMLLPLP